MRAIQEHTPLQKIEDELLIAKGIQLYIKRDDLIHPLVSGNKWRKLKYNLAQARAENHHTLLTFGGPYSNHIYSTAAAARQFGFRSVGIIRGYRQALLTPTLQFAEAMGMQLVFATHEAYNTKNATDILHRAEIALPDFYSIPEGGTNEYAIKGVAEIVPQLNIHYDVLCTACGTGGTLAGLVSATENNKTVIGFSALKGEDTLTEKVKSLSGNTSTDFSINFNYHFGGYAKVNDALIDFIKTFRTKHNIQLEPVYTGKMMYGLFDIISKDYFEPGTTIITLHTGGLQGLCGYRNFFPDWEGFTEAG